MNKSQTEAISVIVPTIGRPRSLRRLLNSLAAQTVRVNEVVIADGSGGLDTAAVTGDPCWEASGLKVRRLCVLPPHAVRQREAAIAASRGDLLLLLDDDVELEPLCVEKMVETLQVDSRVVAVTADFSNQSWSHPTRAWRAYLKIVHGVKEGEWQGRVIGPLLRFGYNPVPAGPRPIEWLGTCNSLIWRDAFEKAGGFSGFFLHRSTMNEDVDLGLKLGCVGLLLFCPEARMAHYQDPAGRMSPYQAAEDDLYNRFLVLHQTMGCSRARTLLLVATFFVIESLSNLAGVLFLGRSGQIGSLFCGRLSGLFRAVVGYRSLDDSAKIR